MAKPEWGTKRTCPQTGERFYDLGKDNPVISPNGHEWYPEPVLKSKQPVATPAPEAKEKPSDEDPVTDEDDETSGLDLDDDDIEVEGDDDDDVLGDVSLDDDDADLSDVVKAPGDDED